jgi:VRR-NUC domain
MCASLIARFAPRATIGFSAIRGLARRLQKPLCMTLSQIDCVEAEMLGLQYGEAKSQGQGQSQSRYSDWCPQMDFAVANAIDGNSTVGARCGYIGHDESHSPKHYRSLRVEQLAIEYYNTGRLSSGIEPVSVVGGWVGWHDEGGHVRALFRIMTTAAIMGADWGCSSDYYADQLISHTLLSPYQNSPFDLHVGYELDSDDDAENKMGDSGHSDGNGDEDRTGGSNAHRCFYHNHRVRIEQFLNRLHQLSKQQICDYVYDCTRERLRHMCHNRKQDTVLCKDLAHLRTLSMVAAGLGGKVLASIFRCFFFDYRHYSGGLPDLTLIRAYTSNESPGLVDLGKWVGESFDPVLQRELEAKYGASMLQDDDFLGCDMASDSVDRARSLSRKRDAPAPKLKPLSIDDMPNRLILSHDSETVVVQVMLVEVKSSNDRLDARQEDWLNVIDQHGIARVCKFQSSKNKQKNAPQVVEGAAAAAADRE